MSESPPTLLAPVRVPFRAIAATVVPDAARLDEHGWAALEAVIEEQLATRPAPLRRQLVVFIRLVDALPLARWGRRFRALDAARRTRVLEALQDAPVLLLRRGFWGLRTLVFMGYYTRPGVASAIGYRAHLRGWLARRPAAARQPVAIPAAPRPSVPRPAPPPPA